MKCRYCKQPMLSDQNLTYRMNGFEYRKGSYYERDAVAVCHTECQWKQGEGK